MGTAVTAKCPRGRPAAPPPQAVTDGSGSVAPAGVVLSDSDSGACPGL